MSKRTATQEAVATEAAWRIHAAQSDWTARVDAKAGFAFALESAAIATVVTLSAEGRLFGSIERSLEQWLYGLGLSLLIAGAAAAGLVVVPQLRARQARQEAARNFIYFGHARHWDADRLAAALRSGNLLPQLTRQITAMADIAWRKHLRVQWSLWLAFAGAVLLVSCGLLTRFC